LIWDDWGAGDEPQPLEIRGFFCWIEKKGGGFIYWLVEIFD
jgi:hypothetical protein